MKRVLIFIFSIGCLLAPANVFSQRSANIVPDATLEEWTLDSRSLQLTLVNDTFLNPSILSPGSFILQGAPAGLTIGSVTDKYDKTCTLNLNFTYTDFDTDSINFTVYINSDVLKSDASLITSPAITIYAYVENPQVVITSDSIMAERTLDRRSLSLKLKDDKFKSTPAKSDVLLKNYPAGLDYTLSDIQDSSLTINLTFDMTDFDVNYVDFQVEVKGNCLNVTPDASSILSNKITIYAYIEQIEATLTPDHTLNEWHLGNRYINLQLEDEEFKNTGYGANDFTFLGGPANLTKTLSNKTLTTVRLNLDFDNTNNDFDSNYPYFRISINKPILKYSSANLVSDSLIIYAFSETPVAEITADDQLYEVGLDSRYLDLKLKEEFFTSTPLTSFFAPRNAPAGLTLQVASTPSPTDSTVRLNINYSGGDFDVDYPDFHVWIDGSKLLQSADSLLSEKETITAWVEDLRATLTASGSLYEPVLDSRYIDISFYDESFINPGSLVKSKFKLKDAPPGLVIGSISNPLSKSVRLNLDFTGDFDKTYPNFHVWIDSTVLNLSVNSVLTDTIPITFFYELPEFTVAPNQQLTEENLNVSSLTLTLVEDSFINFSGIQKSHFTLNNTPWLTTIGSIDSLSPVQIRLNLDFNGKDFDVNYTQFTVTINPVVLVEQSTSLVSKNMLTIIATDEPAVMSLAADKPLAEYNLNGRQLTLQITQDTLTTLSLVPSDFILNKGSLSNLQITGVNAPNRNTVVLTLGFTYQDIDVNFNSFYVTIKANRLEKSIADLASANNLVITAYVEVPQATIVADSVLTEYRFKYRSLNLKLHDEKFKVVPVKANFSLVNAPPGTSIGSITNVQDSSVTILLTTTGADFDISYPNFRLSIVKDVLLQTTNPTLLSNSIIVYPNHEPFIISVTIPDHSYKVNDVVTGTITLNNNVDSLFTYRTGNIGGYAIDSLKRDGSDINKYYAYFRINEGGIDYPANQNVPVNNLQLKDGFIIGNIWSNSIIQANDLIDANTPKVTSILPVGSGIHKIGDKVYIVVTADNKDYTLQSVSTINTIPATSPNIAMVDNQNGIYTFTYTVQQGNPDVSAGSMTASFVYSDVAGNKNAPYSTVSSNDIIIDAHAPVILKDSVSSSDSHLSIGDKLILIVTADGSDYTADNSTKINNVQITDPSIVFQNVGANKYRFTYTVKEGHSQVLTPGGLQVSLVFADAFGNKNTSPFTTVLNNNVTIYTTKPSAILSSVKSNICYGDTGELSVQLTGTPPFNVVYKEGTTTRTLDNINTTTHNFFITPLSTTVYIISSITDATQNTGSGTGNPVITVNPLPIVDILYLDDIYSVETDSVPLTGSPAGGVFTGVGVQQAKNGVKFFNPSAAGTAGSPHRIYYTYTIQTTGCVNVDSASVNVIAASAVIYFGNFAHERAYACWYEDYFEITAQNTSGTTGYFTTDPVIDNFLTDNGNNAASMNPMAVDWGSIQDNLFVDITYHYTDEIGTDLSEVERLEIDYFQAPRIVGLESTEYCSNEPAFELEGTYPSSGTFSIAKGVTGNVATGYEFNPGAANLGITKLFYTQLNERTGCVLKDSVNLTVHPTPDAEFRIEDTCIVQNGSYVSFTNTTDTTDLGEILWAWTFGDFINNTSSEANPSHFYQLGGSRTITLTATTTPNGCINTQETVFPFGYFPEAGFTWETECYTGKPIKLNQAVTSLDPVSSYRWKIFSPEGVLLEDVSGLSMTTHSFSFPDRDEYPVEISVITERGCYDSYKDTLLLRPYNELITTDDPYFEDFENNPPGWYSTSSKTTSVNSWVYSSVNSSAFPYTASSGSKAWYTNISNRTNAEQSWITSPCFKLSGLRRPMISLKMKRSFERDRDGAVLQYTKDNGKTWINVGTLDDGSINWYNSFRIQNGPGEQDEGWTGEFIFVPDNTWVNARHELDELRKASVVQFRIAYGSDGSSVVQNNGFAFDDIWIGERSRLVLLEHFTNASDSTSKRANDQVNNLVDENSFDVIDIQYHMDKPGADKMYQDYPIGPSARSLYYGISSFPYTFLDGGGSQGLYKYDYKTKELSELNLYTRVLRDPEFDMDLTVAAGESTLDVSVYVEALQNLDIANYTVHVAVVEKQIDDPVYQGLYGQVLFENVVRQMLPDAGGTNFLKQWTKGESKTVNLSWNIHNILDREMMFLVAFIQNRETKQVYQAVTNDPDATATSVKDYLKANHIAMLVYPNPASDQVTVALDDPLTERSILRIYNHTGQLVDIHQLETGMTNYQFNTAEYRNGLYYLQLIQGNSIIGTQKMVVE